MSQKLHDEFDIWLSGCESKLKQPLQTEGDPQQIRKELEELKVRTVTFTNTIDDSIIYLSTPTPLLCYCCSLQALSEEISGHKADLDRTVEAGRDLESYTDAEPGSLPDIGYGDLQGRYDAVKVNKTR